MTTRYEIRKGTHAPCDLVSIATKSGREYVNFVADGTHTFCANIKATLEKEEPKK